MNFSNSIPFFFKFQYETKEQLLEQLLECDIIIYDIIEDTVQVDEACWAITSLHNELEKIDKPKLFILLSTAMTWAKSKPTDPVRINNHN